MEIIEIELLSFVSPHLFYISTDLDHKQRSNFLETLSSRIKKCHLANFKAEDESVLQDEIVAVHHGADLVRAKVLEIVSNEDNFQNLYFCWLIDYAVLIKTEKLYRLPKEIQKITPRCKQASLNNICYLREQLELGVTGTIKTVPSVVPSSGVIQYSLELIENSDKLGFVVAERFNNTLVGELLIYKNDKTIYLTIELINKGLLTINELMFQNLKYSTNEYIKTHLKSIYHVSDKAAKKASTCTPCVERLSSPSNMVEKFLDSLENLVLDNPIPLENGRRRKLISKSSCQAKTENHSSPVLRKIQNSKDEAPSEKASDPAQEDRLSSKNIAVDLQINSSPELLRNENSPPLSRAERLLQKINAMKCAQQGLNIKSMNEPNSGSSSQRRGACNSAMGDANSTTEQEEVKLGAAKKDSEDAETPNSVTETECNRAMSVTSSTTEEEGIKVDHATCNTAVDDTSSKTEEEGATVEPEKKECKNDETSDSVAESACNSTIGDTSSTTEEEEVKVEPAKEDSKDDETSNSVAESESNISPFASITSRSKAKPKCLLYPAGMERTMNQVTPPKSKAKKSKKDAPSTSELSVELSGDGDCPTIEVPKGNESLTDDEIVSEEIQTTAEKLENSSTSDTPTNEVFTKQDFCKLIAGCTCIKCRVALEDDDWDAPLKFNDNETSESMKKLEAAGSIIKPPKLLKPEAQIDEDATKRSGILSIDYKGMSAMEKKLSCKVLVQGESIPTPIRHVAQVNIHKEIYSNINKLNYKQSKRIQHYAFPAITRNQHVFMVNDQKTGKTMAYLPILISFVMEKQERYSQLFKLGGGPIVIILCSNSKKCEEIYDLTKLILNRQKHRCSLVTYPRYGNISNIDILITMPTVLTSLISSRATNFKRLCHLVLEDADVMLKSHNELIKKYLNYADQILEHRNCPKSIQLIMCAHHWTSQMEDVLVKLNKVPMVCIGNHLEAALYGKMKFTMKFLDTGCKEENLQKILQDTYRFTRSVIICNSDDVEDVQTLLTLKGIEFTSFVGVTQEEDILYLEAVWSNAQPGKFLVLLCTDDIYNTMNITSAQLLVHFSLPHSWTQFIKRFSCLLENIQTPLEHNQKKMEISSFVFIDENCESRMSRFKNFLKISGLEKVLPDKVKTFFQAVVGEEEQKRLMKKVELCHTVRIFGKCDSLQCEKRHILNKDLDSSKVLPKNGSIWFKIIIMTGAGSCSIKLLEHFDLKGQSVRKFKDLSDEIADIIRKNNNYHPINKPKIMHLYLHQDGDQYYRCRLMEIDDFALIYLIDRGIYCKSNLNKLHKIPEELKKIPPQTYEVHFANLVPPYEDNRFSRLAGRRAQFLIDSNCPDSIMTATVLLQLGNNLWLDDVCEYREMYDKSLPSMGFQLTRELIKQELAVKNNKPLEELYDLCRKAGFELPEYGAVRPTVKRVVVQQVQPNWAFLDTDAVHEVTFTFGMSPEDFCVRQNKFSKQLQRLEEDIQMEIRKPFYPSPKKIEVGKCYLVKDQVTGEYARGMVLNIDGEQAEILCVDYGDVVMDDISHLKHITNEVILKLPFQSIHCSLYGIRPVEDDWNDAATNLLYTIAYEEDSYNTLRSLFIKISSKQDNPIVKRQNSYSVIMKDGLKRRILINDLLVDCGFALPNGEEIRDFNIPEVKSDSDEESVEEIERDDDDEEFPKMSENEDMDLSAFDCEIFNLADFMTDMNLPVNKLSDAKAIEDKKPASNQLPAIKAAPAVDYLTPEVAWSQTDANVKLTIKISDVGSAKMVVKLNRKFEFSTTKEEKKYYLNLLLFAKVENTFQHTILGSQIRVTLKKKILAEWPRLLHSKEKVRKIHYDVSSIPLEDEEEKVRRPLDLGISDSSSDDDERPYFVCSDLDSDYDYDMPNDEC